MCGGAAPYYVIILLHVEHFNFMLCIGQLQCLHALLLLLLVAVVVDSYSIRNAEFDSLMRVTCARLSYAEGNTLCK